MTQSMVDLGNKQGRLWQKTNYFWGEWRSVVRDSLPICQLKYKGSIISLGGIISFSA